MAIIVSSNLLTVAIIDNEDIDLADFNWTDDRGYFKGNKQVLHRIIMQRMVNFEMGYDDTVDHIDGDTYNNCRENLRIVTRAENVRLAAKRRALRQYPEYLPFIRKFRWEQGWKVLRDGSIHDTEISAVEYYRKHFT